jgi:hypothetical protein
MFFCDFLYHRRKKGNTEDREKMQYSMDKLIALPEYSKPGEISLGMRVTGEISPSVRVTGEISPSIMRATGEKKQYRRLGAWTNFS